MSDPILVGYDGSKESDMAVAWAAEAASSRNVGLHLVSAWTLPPTEVGVAAGPAYETRLLEDMRTEAEDHLAKGMALATEAAPNVEVSGEMVTGPAAAVLLDRAENAQMVVLGSHGHSKLTGMFLGSVSRQVATHVECPAVVIRPPHDKESRTLVVGVDGSEASINALDFAFEVASRQGYELKVLHAWEIPPIGAITGVPVFSPPELIEDLSQMEMRTVAEELAGHRQKYPDVSVTTKVIQGSPSRSLQDESESAAMVVLGSRGRGGFRGLLLGSVGHSVVARAKCPVAIIR